MLDARPAPAIYRLVVRNDGRSAAGPFAVQVAGALSEVAGLAAGETIAVTVVAAACAPGSSLRRSSTPTAASTEADERNGLRRGCPLASSDRGVAQDRAADRPIDWSEP